LQKHKHMKIYTKTGDKGDTSLIGGIRVPKYHPEIEAYGTIDELNSYIGLIRGQKIDKHTIALLIEIQKKLFVIGSLLTYDDKKDIKLSLLNNKDILLLEKEINKISETLPKQDSFIIPGGNTIVSYCHIARCVCRRAERKIVKLRHDYYVNEINIKYINRLSDYLFILARKLAKDLNVKEIKYKINT